MSASNLSGDASSTSITFSEHAFTEIILGAKRFGLSPQAYLVALNAIQNGRVPPDTLRVVGEIYEYDRETLRELAK